MSNNVVKVPDEILSEVNNLISKSGMSKEDFINYLSKFYHVNDVIDPSSYYDSFTA